jgi:hypothetical protein
MIMKSWVSRLVFSCGAVAAGGTHAAISCSITANAVNVTYTGAVVNTGNTIVLNCTRLASDPTTQTYWVGITPTSSTTRRLYRHGAGTAAADRLNIRIFKNATTTDWDNTGGSRVNGTLNFGASLSTSATLDYDLRITAGQTGKNAGIYDDVYTASLQFATAGAVAASTTFVPTANVPTECFVGQVPSGNTAPGAVEPTAMALSYNSFSPSAQTTNMTFTVDCTLNTSYQLGLAPSNGTLLGLNYTVRFSNGLAIWTGRLGSGVAQPYTVTATIPAGQAGTCATPTCTATQATTITITY